MPRIMRSAAVAAAFGTVTVLLTTCRLDELISPPAVGLLTTSISQIVDSAAVGSIEQRATTLGLAIPGERDVSWTATRAAASAWLSLNPASGTGSDSLTATLRPANLPIGVYQDTILFKVGGGASNPAALPVRFTIHPCSVVDILPSTAVTDSVTTASCTVPRLANRFAAVFGFTAAAGDSVSILLTSSDFDAYVVLDSTTNAAAPSLVEADHCQGTDGDPCLIYVLLPDSGRYFVRATTAHERETGEFNLQLSLPRPPSVPSYLGQFMQDSVTELPLGAGVSDSSLVLKAVLDDPDMTDSLRLQVEVQPVDSTFAGSATGTSFPVAGGDTALVVILELDDDTEYRWLARAVDQTGRASGWASFGANPNDAADFRVTVPNPPNPPNDIGQYRSDGATVILLGQATPERTVVFAGIVTDPDFPDHLRLEVEVRPVGVAFTGMPIGSSVHTTNGDRALVSIPGLDDDTEYHWQTRVVDQDMNASEWTQFGGNPETEADFKIAVPSVPFVPAALAQLRADGTTAISVGETVDEATVVYRAAVSDPDPGDLLRLQTETRPIEVPFTGFPTDSSTQISGGGPVSVTVSGLPDDVSYHWRARVTDQGGNESAWISFGDNADVDVDFAVAVPASTLGFTTQPSAVRYGATFQPPIATTALEPSGAADTSFTGQVTIAIAPNSGTPGAVLSGTTVQNAVLGVTRFDDLSIDLVGSGYVLTATSPGLPSVGSVAFDVLPGSAGRLAVVVQPSASAQSGVTLIEQPAVQVQDSDGHDVSDSGLTVTAEIASGPAGAALSSATAVTNSSGRAIFDGLAIFGRVGDYVLRFTNPGLLPHISEGITLNPGLADPATTTAAVPDGAAGFTTTIVVTVRDVSGNALSGGGEVVAASVTGANDGAAMVEDHGDSTYTATYTPTLAGTDSVAITLAGQQITGSPYISVVTSTAASQMTLFTGDNQTAVVGVAVPVPPAVLVTDEYGNGIAEVEVSFTVTAGAGRVNPTSPVITNADGVAQVHAWILGPISGANQLTAAAASLAGSPVVFTATGTAGAVSPSQSTLTATPESLVADGSISTITVTARDANGNAISDAVVVLAATGTGNTVTQPAGPTDASGEATGTLSSTVAEVKTVSATVAGTTITQRATVVVTAGAASQLGITAQPSSVQSGLPFDEQPVIDVRDAYGNGVGQSGIVVTASIATGGGLLGGTVTATTDSTGLATFTDLSLTGVVGDRTLLFDAAGVAGVTSDTIAVTAGTASQLSIVRQPSATVQSGFPLAEQPVIRLRDVSGNDVSQAGVVVTAAIATGDGTLGGRLTVTTDSSGVATFTDLSVLGVVGARTLQFAATGLTPVVSNTISVTAGDASRLTIVTQPSSSVRSGEPFSQQPVIQLQDASGNNVNQSAVLVTASIVTGGGTLGGTLTATTDAAGVATFADLSITGVTGDRTLWFEAAGFSAVISDPINVTGGPASELSVATQPSATVQSGIVFPQQPVIQLLDAAGNNANDGGVDVTVSLATGGGALGGTLTVPTDASGAATFTDLSLTGVAGERTLQFAAEGLAGVTSASISVAAGVVSQLSIATQPSESAQSGVAFPEQPVIELQDASGNHVSLPGVIVTASIATGGGTLGGTVAAATDSGGVATFTDLSIMGVVGERTLQFAAAGLTGVTSAPITLTAGVASQLSITTQPPASAQNGVPFDQQPVIQLQDAGGNNVNQSGLAVTASIATGGGSLGGSLTAMTNGGVAIFTDLSLVGLTGERTLQFSAVGLASVTSTPIDLTAGAASRLSIATQPSASVQNAVPFVQQPVIQLQDAGGNDVNQSGVVVTASIATGGGSLGGSLTATTTNGVAAFADLSITGSVGDRTLQFAADGLTLVTSSIIAVTAGTASQLGITNQPSESAQSGMVLQEQPVIQLQDASGNDVSEAGVIVAAAIATGGGTLGGTLTATTDAGGQAMFADLSITGAVGERTLQFAAAGLASVTSAPINLNAGVASQLSITTQPSASVQSGVPFPRQPVIQLQDDNGNDATQSGVVVTASIESGGGTLGGIVSVATNASGVAAFADLSLTGEVGDRTLRFRATDMSEVQSNTIAVTAGIASQLSLTIQPSSPAENAVPFAQQPVIQLQDLSGNSVSQSGVAVTASIETGGGTLGGTLTVTTDADGVATFTDLSLVGLTGARTLRFAATDLTSVISSKVDLKVGVATRLSITTQPPAFAQSGVKFSQEPVVQLLDSGGNNVKQSKVQVTVSIATGGGVLAGTLTVGTDAKGAAKFKDLTITGVDGERTLRFTAAGLTEVTSETVTLTDEPAAGPAPSALASSVAAGASLLMVQKPATK